MDIACLSFVGDERGGVHIGNTVGEGHRCDVAHHGPLNRRIGAVRRLVQAAEYKILVARIAGDDVAVSVLGGYRKLIGRAGIHGGRAGYDEERNYIERRRIGRGKGA